MYRYKFIVLFVCILAFCIGCAPKKMDLQKQTSNSLQEMLTQPQYINAKNKVLDPKKLRIEYDNQLKSMLQNRKLTTQAYLIFKKDSFQAFLNSTIDTEFKGYLLYHIPSQTLEINFGEKYGYIKKKVGFLIAEKVLKDIQQLKAFYHTDFSFNAIFEYDTRSIFNKQIFQYIEVGQLTTNVEAIKRIENYLPNDQKHRAAVDVFWNLVFIFSPPSELTPQKTMDLAFSQ